MNDSEREIIKALVEETGIEEDEIISARDLYSLGIDSLSALEILAALEKKFCISIPGRDLKNINSPMEIVRLISKEVKKK